MERNGGEVTIMRFFRKDKQPRLPRPERRMQDPARARLTRFDDPATAEDDYFRLTNRGH